MSYQFYCQISLGVEADRKFHTTYMHLPSKQINFVSLLEVPLLVCEGFCLFLPSFLLTFFARSRNESRSISRTLVLEYLGLQRGDPGANSGTVWGFAFLSSCS